MIICRWLCQPVQQGSRAQHFRLAGLELHLHAGFIGQVPGACELSSVGPGGGTDGVVAGQEVPGWVSI